MKITNHIFFFALLLTVVTFTACDDDEGVDITEQELITTVTMILTPDQTTETISFSIRDTDGPGGNAPMVDTLQLAANLTYFFSLEFLDESDMTDVEDITAEVRTESDEHLVCYSASGAAIVPTITDTDGDGNPLGLTGTFTTGNAGTDSLTVRLKHQPDKSATDPCATGETDVEVTFPVVVQ